MSIVSLLREALDYGRRLGLVDREVSKGPIYTLEIGDEPVLTLHEDLQVALPMPRDRGSNIDRPNALYDNLKYLALREKSHTAFWEQAIAAANDVRAIKIAKALQATRDKLLSYKATLTKEVGQNRWWTLTSGRKVVAENVPEAAWIVLTHEGTPLFDLPKFKEWWSTAFAKAASDDDTEMPTDIDFLTGAPCVPVNTHTRVSGFAGAGGKIAVVSYNYATCTFDSYAKGQAHRNFPISRLSDKLYTRGLTYAGKGSLNDDLTLVMWPAEGDVDHPIVPSTIGIMSASRFTEAEKTEAFWATLSSVSDDDETPIVVALTRGSRSRLGLLEFDKIQANRIKANLLRFRVEFGGRAVLFQRSACVPVFDGKKAKNALENYMHKLAWPVISGGQFPDYYTTLFNKLTSKADLDESEGRTLFKLLAAWMTAIQARKEGRIVMPNDTLFDAETKPELQSFCPDHLTGGDALKPECCAYNFGRLVAVFSTLYFGYQGLMVGNKELHRSTRYPRTWLANRRGMAQVYIEKAIRFGWDRHMEELFLSTTIQLGTWAPVSMSPQQRSDHKAGFFAQGAYNRAYIDWAKAERARHKKEKQKEEKAEAAAE
jgi:hypothetical protein